MRSTSPILLSRQIEPSPLAIATSSFIRCHSKRRPTPRRRGTRDAASLLTPIAEAEDHRASNNLLRVRR